MNWLDYRLASIIMGAQIPRTIFDVMDEANTGNWFFALCGAFAIYGFSWLTVALWREA